LFFGSGYFGFGGGGYFKIKMIEEINRRIIEVKREIKDLKDFIYQKYKGHKSFWQDMRENYQAPHLAFLEGKLKSLKELKKLTRSVKKACRRKTTSKRIRR
jgi:hypothetical protein